MPRSDSSERTVFSLISKCPDCGMHPDGAELVCPHDGSLLAQGLAPGTVIAGRYKFISSIGSGGMGLIVKAHDTLLGVDVALKMLLRNSNKSDILRFKREAKAVSLLSHEHIIKVHAFDVTSEGLPYMVMEFIEGEDLDSVLNRRGALKIAEARRLFEQLFDAMSYAHNRGVCHRDLKPSNIMLLADDDNINIKLVDFGIAKITESDTTPGVSKNLTDTGQIIGSPIYMSPEQALGKPIDARTDIYSAGCVIYHTLTGAPPIAGDTTMETLFKHVNFVPPSMSEASLGISFPAELETLVARALSKSPADRQQSFAQLQSEFNAAVGGTTGTSLKSVSNVDKVESGDKQSNKSNSSANVIAITAVMICISFAIGLTAIYFGSKPAHAPVRLSDASKVHDAISSLSSMESKAVASRANGEEQANQPARDLDKDASDNGVYQLDLNTDAIAHEIIHRKAASDDKQVTINATDRNVGDETIRYLVSEFKSCPERLVELNFGGSHVTDAGIHELMSLGPKLKLKTLLLGQTKIGKAGIQEISKMKSIEFLDLYELHNLDSNSFSPLGSLSALKSLNISTCKVVGDHPLNFDFLSKLVLLRRLESRELGSFVTNDNLVAIAHCKNLKKVNLSWCDIDVKGIEHLGQLRHIESLILGGTRYDGSNLAAILQNMPDIKHLGLNSQGITDDVLVQLGKLYEKNVLDLDVLDIRNCRKLSAEAYLRLKDEMPRCIINFVKEHPPSRN
jgi:serine/threonine protein kinase